MKKFRLETGFSYKCYSSPSLYDVNTYTNSNGNKKYTLVFNGSPGFFGTNLEFNQSHGLINADTKEEVISTILSIYNTYHADLDIEKYSQSLLHFFQECGPFFNDSDERIPLTIIDNYIGLISHLSNTLAITASKSPLNKEQCSSLLHDIVYYTFYDCNGLEYCRKEVPEMPLHAFQRLSYLKYRDDDYNQELLGAIRQNASCAIEIPNEFDDADEIIYNSEDVVQVLFSAIDKNTLLRAIKDLYDTPNDIYTVIDFLYSHLDNFHISLSTNAETGQTSLTIQNYDFSKEATQLIDIASNLAAHFLKLASSKCAPSFKINKEKYPLNRELYFPVDSLFDAILLALLFSDFSNYEYRTCELDNCSKQFWVKINNHKKKFCCRAHSLTAATHKFRQKSSSNEYFKK